MKKHIILVSLLSVGFVSAQTGRVGINTETPNATLEIKGTPTDTSVTDGLIAPKIDGDQLKAKDNLYNDDQKGALVYVTAVPTTRTGKVVNVDSVGYYYFDGSLWIKLKTDIPTAQNIYTNDGNLEGNRTVTMGNHTLKFTGNTTSFVKNDDALSLKNITSGGANYMTFFKNGESGSRSAYFGFASASNNNFTLKNELGENIIIAPNSTSGTTEVNSNLKINTINTGTFSNGNVLITDNGVVKKTSIPNEPWRVQNSTTEATANTQNIYQNGNVGIGDFSNKTATNNLDIDGSLRVRNLEPEHGRNLYNLVADENGVVIRISPQNFVEAGNVFATEYKDVDIEIPDSGNPQNFYNTYLGFYKTIRVPKGRKYLLMMQLSVPMAVTNVDASDNGAISMKSADGKTTFMLPKRFDSYFGVKLSKADGSLDNGGTISNEKFLNQVSRKTIIPERADHTIYPMTTITTQHYEILDNSNGTTDKYYTYKPYGYSETGYGYGGAILITNYTVRYNMFETLPNDKKETIITEQDKVNYSWGQASLSYQLYSVQ